MIKLSDSLRDFLIKELDLDSSKTEFDINELDKVTTVSLSKTDMEYLKYFNNLTSISLDSFPSIDNNDILEIVDLVPNLKCLKIKEQSALINLDLSGLKKLEELCIIHNDNLENIYGIDKLNRFTFYDNKDFKNVKQIVDLVLSNQNSVITLDIIYYIDVVRMLAAQKADVQFIDRFKWVESVGLREYIIHEYTNDEIKSLIYNVSSIVSKYIYVTDGDTEKFGVLYKWMVDNIRFVNEDDPKDEDVESVSNIYKVFNYGKGGRLSFAKAFQLLLSFAGINSSVVYSLGALETIGYYNGQKVYSLLGTSDYALLRVSLDNRYYYCDIAWDTLVRTYKFFDELRLFLVSKDELRIRHKLVGEGNIENSYSYHGDDSDDLIMFASDRLKEVNELFNDIERLKPSIVGVEINRNLIQKNINNLKEKINQATEEDSSSLKNELKELELQLEEEDIELVKLGNQREGIIRSYYNELVSHYLVDEDEITKSEKVEQLKEMYSQYYMSSYIYDILTETLKTA